MSSINNLGNSGYYQLNNPNAGTNGSNQTNSTLSLVQALNGQTQTGVSSSNDAYLLSLSPEAQKYLNGTSSLNTQQSFILSDKQKQTINDIIAKYKDAPYDQKTFEKIQADLNAEGLGTTTLALLDKAKSFNPTSLLIDALTGGKGVAENSGFTTEADQKNKSNSYIQNIISQWKNLAGNNKAEAEAETQSESSTSTDAVQATGGSSQS
jgi:hypothetical protein